MPVHGDRSHHQGGLDNTDDDGEVVLNRARLYHDRRDFYIRFGDIGVRDDHPFPSYRLKQNDADDSKEQEQ